MATLLLASAPACFTEVPGGDETALPRADAILGLSLGSEGAPAEVSATYWVPVPDDLAAHATYVLTDATAVVGAALTVSFTLPEGLLGFPVAVTFRGTGGERGEIAVTGGAGSGTCWHADVLECELRYYPIHADLDAVRAYWQARGDAAASIDARVAVASLFDDDPLGIVRIRAR